VSAQSITGGPAFAGEGGTRRIVVANKPEGDVEDEAGGGVGYEHAEAVAAWEGDQHGKTGSGEEHPIPRGLQPLCPTVEDHGLTERGREEGSSRHVAIRS
jgi:hypothetical protein